MSSSFTTPQSEAGKSLWCFLKAGELSGNGSNKSYMGVNLVLLGNKDACYKSIFLNAKTVIF